MNKKGDLTINLIVIAVVALLVLVILVAIFSGKMGIFGQGTQEPLEQTCSGRDGYIIPFSDACDPGSVHSTGAYTDVDPGFKCCIPE